MKQLMVLVAVMVLGLSASADDSIIGQWVQDVSEQGVTILSYYDFGSDGKFVQDMLITCPSPKMDISMSGKGPYSYLNGTLTLKCEPEYVTVSKFYIEGADQNMINAAVEQQKAQMASLVFKLSDVKVNGDKMTAVYNGTKITLRRVK